MLRKKRGRGAGKGKRVQNWITNIYPDILLSISKWIVDSFALLRPEENPKGKEN
jgi:hypothetical protein